MFFRTNLVVRRCWRSAAGKPQGGAFQTLSAVSSSPSLTCCCWRKCPGEVASGSPGWSPRAGPRSPAVSFAGRRWTLKGDNNRSNKNIIGIDHFSLVIWMELKPKKCGHSCLSTFELKLNYDLMLTKMPTIATFIEKSLTKLIIDNNRYLLINNK